ncbi:hypothetical protein CPB84DRAFT_1966252 [Gymnopilus junonius]|uniref:Uncharacterized protein n=1 Tax=Gymnopilus junonius TaxID=109634 RepID=A0A9P5NB01_GYMJU|nr:hypothetical protein CPB84DRAFT_1966252 [Gymnopilus junonius]
MRFSAPRSPSPSPVRGRARNSSTFGVPDDSDSDEYYSELESSFNSDSGYDAVSIASTSSPNGSTYDLVNDLNKISIRPRHITRTPLEEREIEETVASIRLQNARKEFSTTQAQLHARQEQLRAEEEKRRAAQFGKYAAEVQAGVERRRLLLLESEKKMKDEWATRNRQLWERIEAVIKMEEDKRRLEEEKKQQEEAARKKAEEERKKAEEEKAQQEKEEAEKRIKLEEDRKHRERRRHS